jgi:glycosyltransferase involved in cell wall biosynthesis
MKRCLVYDPYLSTLGGGERYVYALAEALESSVEVHLAALEVPDPERLRALEFAVRPVAEIHPLEFPEASAAYDLAVYLTNSPPPPSYAAHSLLVVQFPFEGLSGETAVRAEQRHALERYACVVYSEFARDWLRRRWDSEATILHPPVDIGSGAPGKKGDLILGVGRFFSAEHSKRQDVLVSAFRSLQAHADFAGWRLVLAGGAADDEDGREFVAAVRSSAESLPVEIEENVSQDRLRDLYHEATFFWHATGFGRGPNEPERAEHFGMSTVEAMSYGAVPLVFADGGQLEVVTHDWGRLWHTPDELVQQTLELVRDRSEVQRLANSAVVASQSFARPIFVTKLKQLVESLWAREVQPQWSRRDAMWSRAELGFIRHLLGEANADVGRAQVQLEDYERQLQDTQARAQGQLEVYEAALKEARDHASVGDHEAGDG